MAGCAEVRAGCAEVRAGPGSGFQHFNFLNQVHAAQAGARLVS